MLHNLITQKSNQWLTRPDCPVKELISCAERTGQLRDAQIEAIKTYLFLKIEGQNKPLWQLFSEGFFLNGQDLSQLNINENARRTFESNARDLRGAARRACAKLLRATRFVSPTLSSASSRILRWLMHPGRLGTSATTKPSSPGYKSARRVMTFDSNRITGL